MKKDKSLEIFEKKVGAPNFKTEVPLSSIEKYKGILPNKLLDYWRTEGWCSYADGLVWTVNPAEYHDLVTHWLENSFLAKVDNFHVFARTAFGKLYLWGESLNNYIVLTPYYNAIFAYKEDFEIQNEDPDFVIESFFADAEKENFDINAEDEGMLFDKVLSLLGPVAADEIYGFEPALILGGEETYLNLKKLGLLAHLVLLRNFYEPEIYG